MTTYEYTDHDLSYQPGRGYWHFVVYVEPPGAVTSSANAAVILEDSTDSPSRYLAEWKNRLVRCEPDALHVLRVGSNDARMLWDPCVYDDPDSPSAVGQSGCLCWQTFRDPATWLPVAANHYRTVGGNIEQWRYHTYAPLALGDGERVDRLIIDQDAHAFWIRTDSGTLYLLPERRGQGYGAGYSGGGPVELARMIEAMAATDGSQVSARPVHGPNPKDTVLNWISRADRTQELTLDQMKTLCQGGRLPGLH